MERKTKVNSFFRWFSADVSLSFFCNTKTKPFWLTFSLVKVSHASLDEKTRQKDSVAKQKYHWKTWKKWEKNCNSFLVFQMYFPTSKLRIYVCNEFSACACFSFFFFFWFSPLLVREGPSSSRSETVKVNMRERKKAFHSKGEISCENLYLSFMYCTSRSLFLFSSCNFAHDQMSFRHTQICFFGLAS